MQVEGRIITLKILISMIKGLKYSNLWALFILVSYIQPIMWNDRIVPMLNYNIYIWASNSRKHEEAISSADHSEVAEEEAEEEEALVTIEVWIRVLPPMLSPMALSSINPKTTSSSSALICHDSPNSIEVSTLRINLRLGQSMRSLAHSMLSISVLSQLRASIRPASKKARSSIWLPMTCCPLIDSLSLKDPGLKVLQDSLEQEEDRSKEADLVDLVVDLTIEEEEHLVAHPEDAEDLLSAADDASNCHKNFITKGGQYHSISFSARSALSSPSQENLWSFLDRSRLLLNERWVTIEDGQFVIAVESDDCWDTLDLILDIEFLCFIAVDAGQRELSSWLLQFLLEDGAGRLARRTPAASNNPYSV